jgi:hypothetical protein
MYPRRLTKPASSGAPKCPPCIMLLATVHPILAVIAIGGLVYSVTMCPPALRFSQRVCYGAMLYLAWWCPWPAWVIFLACFGGAILIRVPQLCYQNAKLRRLYG